MIDPMKSRCTEAMADALPRLLRDHGMSLRELSRRIEVSQPHLSQLIHRTGNRRPTGALAEKVAVALGLPPDYFPETRRSMLIEELDKLPELRDELYDRYVDSVSD